MINAPKGYTTEAFVSIPLERAQELRAKEIQLDVIYQWLHDELYYPYDIHFDPWEGFDFEKLAAIWMKDENDPDLTVEDYVMCIKDELGLLADAQDLG
jgi:hypothetical protein